MSKHQVLGYISGNSPLHRLSGTGKLIFLLVISVACMTTYDTRFLLMVSLFSLVLFKISNIHWNQISFVVKFITFFSILNLIAVYIFSPEYGVQLYGSRHIIFQGIGRFTLTQEQLFYEFNLVLKYISTVPLTLVFLLTTNPSEFSSSLNRIGVNYKISYAVALALRYIPDIQEEFFAISQAQQARGIEMSSKGKLSQRIKGVATIVTPLIFSSLERIDRVSTTMELRRFGKRNKRTWYHAQSLKKMDYFIVICSLILLFITFLLFKLNHGRFYNPF